MLPDVRRRDRRAMRLLLAALVASPAIGYVVPAGWHSTTARQQTLSVDPVMLALSTSVGDPQATRVASRSCRSNTQLYATIEAIRGRSSAFSSDDDDEDDEEDEMDDIDAEVMDEIKIAALEKAIQPKSNEAAQGNPSVPLKQQRNNGNAAMQDPIFLRKRTADLFNLTEYAATASVGSSSISSSSTDATAASSLSRNMKVEKKTFHFLMDAWAFSGEHDASHQAIALLERMEALAKLSPTTMQPDVRSYTKTINAIARQRSVHTMENAGEQAEHLLRKLKDLYTAASLSNPETASHLKPNAYTYTAVIQAHANMGTIESAERADWWLTEQMIDQYQRGDDSVRPTSKAFNAVIHAYGQAGHATKAQAVFGRMERLYEAGVQEAKPHSVNYNALITAWANCDDNTLHYDDVSAPLRAEQVLASMEALYQKTGDTAVQPTTVTFNAVIDAWAKAASAGDEAAAAKAQQVLQHMDSLYDSKANVLAKPNARSFNSVMNAYAKSTRDPEAAIKAAELLQCMEQRYEQGDAEVRPDVHSFCTVINAYARSGKSDKAELAYNLYQEMKKLYQAGNKRVRPNVVAVNAVMNACAFTTGDIRQQNRAVEIAHKILKDLEQSPYGSPDQVTYGTFMKTCANQMPDSHTRQQIVEVLFKKCCRDGQFGNLALQQLKAMASDELYQQLIGRSIHDNIQMEDLPKEWWCNVVEGKWRRRRQQG